MANLPTPKIPNLSVTKVPCANNNSCEGTDKKTSISNSDILIHYGEVEITQEIQMGYWTTYFWNNKGQLTPNSKLKTKRIGNPSYKYKYFDPKYLAGALVQLHDYHAAAEDRIVGLPETKLHRASFKKDGSQGDVRLFKKTPWEFFGCTNKEAIKAGWDFGDENYNPNVDWLGDPLRDFSYNPNDPEAGEGIRQDYLREAWELVGVWPSRGKGRLIERKREEEFEDYIGSQIIHAVDYTNEMRMLYGLAATNQLPYDAVQKLYRIENNSTNPGFTRKVKIVYNLYFKVIRGEMSSNTSTVYEKIDLEGKPFTESGTGHKKRSCLKCLVVINKEDGSANREGVYFFAPVWNKGNPAKTFLQPVRELEPAHAIGTKKASGKSTIVGYTDAYRLTPADRANLSPEASAQYLLDVSPQRDWVVLENDLNPWGTEVVKRMELIRFFKYENATASNWEFREASQTNSGQQLDDLSTTYTTRDRSFWTYNKESKSIRIVRPTIEKKGSSGWEITPGLNVYFTAGQNITSGDIAGSSMQFHFILPMEAFAVLFDEEQYGPTTLETLPGKFWNMFSMGVFVAKVDFVQATKDTIKIVDTYLKMEAAKEAMRKMKEYLENMRAKFHQHMQELAKAFEARDLAKYNQILESLKSLATEFQNRVGPNQNLQQSLTQAASAGNQLKIFIDAQNQLQNAPEPSEVINTISPTAPNPPPGEPLPEGLPVGSQNQIEDSAQSTQPGSSLVIPINSATDPIGVNPINQTNPSTNLPTDPTVLIPGIDNPSLGSTHNLGNLGSGFDQDDNSYQDIPGFDLGTTHDTSPPSWYDSGNY